MFAYNFCSPASCGILKKHEKYFEKTGLFHHIKWTKSNKMKNFLLKQFWFDTKLVKLNAIV